jgi:hypothetical protein
MTATQIARLMLITVDSYCNGELPVDEFTGLMKALDTGATDAGIKEEALAAYRQLCRIKNGPPAAK